MNLQYREIDLLVSLYRDDDDFEYLELTPKQEEALRILTNNIHRELLFGGAAGGGKSWLGCVWLTLNCLAYPETRWFIARRTLKVLKRTSLKTLFKVFKKYGIQKVQDYKYNKTDSIITFTNGSQIDLLEVAYRPTDEEFEDLGSYEFTGGWLEEGGEIVSGAYETIKTRIGRQYNDKYELIAKLLVTCNPKKNWMYRDFYRPWKEGVLNPLKFFLQSLISDNDYIDQGYRDILVTLKNKTKKERLLLGNWEYENDPASLCSHDAILDIFTNSQLGDKGSRKRHITADIALQGSDKLDIWVWEDWQVIKIVTLEKSNGKQVQETLKNLKHEFEVPNSRIVYDSDGVGGFLGGFFKGAISFHNNASPLPDGEEKKPNYQNLKSQCAFKLAEQINDAAVYIGEDYVDEDLKEEIIDELGAVLKDSSHGTDKKLSIPKKEIVKELLGRSPDHADNMIMRAVFEFDTKFLNKETVNNILPDWF